MSLSPCWLILVLSSVSDSGIVMQGNIPCLSASILRWSSTNQATVQDTCSTKMKAMQTAAVTQKELNPGMIWNVKNFHQQYTYATFPKSI